MARSAQSVVDAWFDMDATVGKPGSPDAPRGPARNTREAKERRRLGLHWSTEEEPGRPLFMVRE